MTQRPETAQPSGMDQVDPEELFDEPTFPQIPEVIAALADVGLLTERQAEAYIRRAIQNEPREVVANLMDISPSTLDDHLRAAKNEVAAARETVAVLDAYRFPDLSEMEGGAPPGPRSDGE